MQRTLLQCVVCIVCVLPIAAQAQGRPPIREYIHDGWDKLSRSMSDCESVVDTKISGVPVLYLAANERTPKAVTDMQQHCKVDVRRLPRVINQEGDVLPSTLAAPGLLYLPNKYVVPGGRFNEMYGWDSYFILLGEIADGRLDLARGTVENFFYEIDFYGSILNANRTYYLTRSQPPFLSSMVMEVYKEELKKDPREARKFLRHSLHYLELDYESWTTAPHVAGSDGLSRYFDLGSGPVPEVATDGMYYVDVVQWLQAHPKDTPLNFLERARGDGKSACQVATSCPPYAAHGEELTESFFAGDRAMRESGFDTSFRFGPFSGATADYAPICLNSLLFKYERDMAFFELTLDNRDEAFAWSSAAGVRRAVVEQTMWDEHEGLFFDYNERIHARSTYPFLATYYTLWSGLATAEEARRMVTKLPLFERKGGLQASPVNTGMQWDAPYGWAPLNWMAASGLERFGYKDDARRIAREFASTVEHSYEHDGTIREKYNMETASSEVAISSGYKENVIGFGWTNGVYLKLEQLLAEPAAR